jgi:hypothetical protein
VMNKVDIIAIIIAGMLVAAIGGSAMEVWIAQALIAVTVETVTSIAAWRRRRKNLID